MRTTFWLARQVLIALAGLLFLAGHAAGETLSVPDEYPTIQAAINAATSGDTVLVAGGLYSETIQLKSGVNVQGAGAESTTISAVVCEHIAGATVQGFTITGAEIGVRVTYSSLVIANNVITGHSSHGIESYMKCLLTVTDNVISANGGDGVHCIYNYQGPSMVLRNTISLNAGGGVYFAFSPLVVRENTIKGNGYIGVQNNYSPASTVESNAITGNQWGVFNSYVEHQDPNIAYGPVTVDGNVIDASAWDGVVNWFCSPVIRNNVITNSGRWGVYNENGWAVILGNTIVTATNGVYNRDSKAARLINNIIAHSDIGVRSKDWSFPKVLYNDLWQNTTDIVDETHASSQIAQNISSDPLFADPDAGDYRLWDGSPCIDAGDSGAYYLPETDKDGDPRVVGSAVDIGAYEWQGPMNQPPEALALADGEADLTAEQESYDGAAVTLDASLSSDPDGDELVYEWDFESDGIVDSTEPLVDVTYPRGGPFIATLTVIDPHGASDSDTVSITVVDTTPPTIIPPPDITDFPESDPSGTPVPIGEATVWDVGDPAPVVTDNAPGLFPVGTTEVEWRAEDHVGNVSTATQLVVVVPGTPENQLSNQQTLIQDAIAAGLISSELETSLLGHITKAIDALAKDNPNAVKVAMNDLGALINQVTAQDGKKIDPQVATEIIERAEQLIADLGG